MIQTSHFNSTAQQENNYAFIDCQNLCNGLKKLGWAIDWAKFREYLWEKHNVRTAYIFIGYIKKFECIYECLRKSGFELIFKEVVPKADGTVKGNVDTELVFHAMKDQSYDKAVVVTSDGDFCCLVTHLYSQNKLKAVISPNPVKGCSYILRKAGKEKMQFMEQLKIMVEKVAA